MIASTQLISYFPTPAIPRMIHHRCQTTFWWVMNPFSNMGCRPLNM